MEKIYQNRGVPSIENLEGLSDEERSALWLLPTRDMSKQPLDELLEGFLTDLEFDGNQESSSLVSSLFLV